MTLLMAGAGLAAKGLYSERDGFDDAPLDMQPFLIDTDEQRPEWRHLLQPGQIAKDPRLSPVPGLIRPTS